jgi:hypothetical protein
MSTLVYPVYCFRGYMKRHYLFYASSPERAMDFVCAYNRAGISPNGGYLAVSRELPEGAKVNTFNGWEFDFEYGYHTAIHDNYDASWEGDEDGWVDNGLKLSERTLLDLLESIVAYEAEHA